MKHTQLPSVKSLYENEKDHVLSVFALCAGNKTHAARALNIGLRTLQRKLKEYGIAPGDRRQS